MMNVADEMEWYCCGLILLHYLQDRLIMIGKCLKYYSPDKFGWLWRRNRRLAVFSKGEGVPTIVV